MKIRLMGTKEEIDLFIKSIDDELIDEISSFYPNRGNSKLGRVYIETHIKTDNKRFVEKRLVTLCHPERR